MSILTAHSRDTKTAGLPLYRLHLMRAGYLLMGVGLAIVKWPQVIAHNDSRPLFEGVVACILTAMSLLAFLALRYPVKLLPLLLLAGPGRPCGDSLAVRVQQFVTARGDRWR